MRPASPWSPPPPQGVPAGSEEPYVLLDRTATRALFETVIEESRLPEEAVAEPLVLTLHHTAAYMGMRFGGVLLGNGSRPGQVLSDERALTRAKTFFAREAPLARFPYDEG